MTEPIEPPTSGDLVISATVFYLIMALVGVGILHLQGLEPAVVVFGEEPQVLRDTLLGSGAGLMLVVGTHLLRDWPPMTEMKSLMSQTLGRPGTITITVLAVTSSVADEILFRGAIQPLLGLVVTSLIFGLVHGGLSPRFRVWVGFATVGGFVLGGLSDFTGNLLAPMLCHLTLNYFNLHVITQDPSQ
ncbi:MAG: CPBP family intramembrane glutamic endopeptidase [Myxococcota bacterium]|nr:CPBP family intramembrane glutamic endopeptidase [Myxococcota bacterium]